MNLMEAVSFKTTYSQLSLCVYLKCFTSKSTVYVWLIMFKKTLLNIIWADNSNAAYFGSKYLKQALITSW